MTTTDWTPHRREDGELLGWIRPDGEDWVAVDLLGRAASDAGDWLDAEEALEASGLAWLAEPWMLELDGADAVRVKIAEVVPPGEQAPGRVVVHTDDFGAIDAPVTRYELPWPAPGALRPKRPGEVGAAPFA
ncbi:hypothetical protein GCM10022200_22740 [Microbacterium awajiense]|uniref:Uncharacterized protein n=1 Tax=Microbacterium awajiense TaxID=415214 RepID=A0ABP7ASE7_9MICO